MAKEVKKITGDWTKSISEMKLNEVVEFPISAYDGIMSTIRYRVRRRFGIIIKREGELDYKREFLELNVFRDGNSDSM